MNQPDFLKEIIKTSGDIWSKGWAERNAGNISVRLSPEVLKDKSMFDFRNVWLPLDKSIENLKDEFFLVSGTGKYIRNIPVEPENTLGVLQIDGKGENYRVVWGYRNGGKPTSELYAHLQSHSVKKGITDGRDRVIIHTHPANIVALTYALNLDTLSLTRLLWEMHAECVTVYPEGVEFLPWMMAGSAQIADATAKAFEVRNLVVWQYHGIFGSGKDLDTAFGLIDTAEKAAEIYLKAISMGGAKNKLSLSQIKAIGMNFNAIPDEEIFRRLSEAEQSV